MFGLYETALFAPHPTLSADRDDQFPGPLEPTANKVPSASKLPVLAHAQLYGFFMLAHGLVSPWRKNHMAEWYFGNGA